MTSGGKAALIDASPAPPDPVAGAPGSDTTERQAYQHVSLTTPHVDTRVGMPLKFELRLATTDTRFLLLIKHIGTTDFPL